MAFSITLSMAVLLLFTLFAFSGKGTKLHSYMHVTALGGGAIYLAWLGLALWQRSQTHVLLLAGVTLAGIPAAHALLNYYAAYGPTAMDSTFYWFYLLCLLVNIPVALLLVGGLNLLSEAPYRIALVPVTVIGGVCGWLSLLLTVLGTFFAIILFGPSGGIN